MDSTVGISQNLSKEITFSDRENNRWKYWVERETFPDRQTCVARCLIFSTEKEAWGMLKVTFIYRCITFSDSFFPCRKFHFFCSVKMCVPYPF